LSIRSSTRLGSEAQAEVDVNLEALEEAEAEAQFQIPAPTVPLPLPWEERPEQVDDEVEEDYTDDEEDST
jgi:hypothetical protein